VDDHSISVTLTAGGAWRQHRHLDGQSTLAAPNTSLEDAMVDDGAPLPAVPFGNDVTGNSLWLSPMPAFPPEVDGK